VLFVLFFIFWILWLAGIATTQDACSETEPGDSSYNASLEGPQGLYQNIQLFSSTEDCGMELSIEWWVLFFELLIIVCNMQVAMGTVRGFRYEQTFLTFTAINTGLMVVMAPRSVTEAHRFAFVFEKYPVGREVTAAGNVGLLVLNFVYIILYTDKSHQLRPVMRPGLPDAPNMAPLSHDAGPTDGPALPTSSVTNPYYDRYDYNYSGQKDNELVSGPMSSTRV